MLRSGRLCDRAGCATRICIVEMQGVKDNEGGLLCGKLEPLPPLSFDPMEATPQQRMLAIQLLGLVARAVGAHKDHEKTLACVAGIVEHFRRAVAHEETHELARVRSEAEVAVLLSS